MSFRLIGIRSNPLLSQLTRGPIAVLKVKEFRESCRFFLYRRLPWRAREEILLQNFSACFAFVIFAGTIAFAQQPPPQQPPANAAGNWTLYCKDPNGSTSSKYLELKQNGTVISGHFKGPNQSGGVEGTIDIQHLVVRTKTRDVLTFRGTRRRPACRRRQFRATPSTAPSTIAAEQDPSRAFAPTSPASIFSTSLRRRSRCFDARQHLRAGGCVVSKPCFDHGSLHHIALLHAVIQVHVGVVGTRAVLQRILHETDAVQADPREAGRVRAAGLRRWGRQSRP